MLVITSDDGDEQGHGRESERRDENCWKSEALYEGMRIVVTMGTLETLSQPEGSATLADQC